MRPLSNCLGKLTFAENLSICKFKSWFFDIIFRTKSSNLLCSRLWVIIIVWVWTYIFLQHLNKSSKLINDCTFKKSVQVENFYLGNWDFKNIYLNPELGGGFIPHLEKIRVLGKKTWTGRLFYTTEGVRDITKCIAQSLAWSQFRRKISDIHFGHSLRNLNMTSYLIEQ